jgi:IgGFc binding protein
MLRACFVCALGVGTLIVSLAACGRTVRQLASGPDDGGPESGIPSFINDDAAIHECAGADPASSLGCEYLAVEMDGTFDADNGCFVVTLANASPQYPAHVDVSFDGSPIDLSQFAKVPQGSGTSMSYGAYDPNSGIQPGQVVILFLAGPDMAGTPVPYSTAPVPCPVAPALSALTQVHGTGMGQSFRIRTDQPVAAYQMLPYGGGSAAVTGATLLSPTSTYGTNFIAVSAHSDQNETMNDGINGPSIDIVAAEDGTHVTILPSQDIQQGVDVPATPSGQAVTFALSAGQVLQITQTQELTGSVIQSDNPIGLFGGFTCMDLGGSCCCDHSEQQIPGVQQMGSVYAGASYRSRTAAAENRPWRIIGAVDGTQLSFDPPVGGPTSVGQGQIAEFKTDTPFVVSSQDASHPFLLLAYMTGAQTLPPNEYGLGYGDPDVVRSVPTPQWRPGYVFFTDPTYPETDLVFVRSRVNGAFADVNLDCAGTLSGWTAIDSNDDYELTRVDLVRHNFQPQGNCNNGQHEASSSQPFSLTVWGWGSPETTYPTGYVSYGYPGGENLAPINQVVVPAQ